MRQKRQNKNALLGRLLRTRPKWWPIKVYKLYNFEGLPTNRGVHIFNRMSLFSDALFEVAI